MAYPLAGFAQSAGQAAHAGGLGRLLFAGLAADFWFRPGLHSRQSRRGAPLCVHSAVRLCGLRPGPVADDQLPVDPPLPAAAAVGDAADDGRQLALDWRGDDRSAAGVGGFAPPAEPRVCHFRSPLAGQFGAAQGLESQLRQRRRSRSRGGARLGSRSFAGSAGQPAVGRSRYQGPGRPDRPPRRSRGKAIRRAGNKGKVRPARRPARNRRAVATNRATRRRRISNLRASRHRIKPRRKTSPRTNRKANRNSKANRKANPSGSHSRRRSRRAKAVSRAGRRSR